MLGQPVRALFSRSPHDVHALDGLRALAILAVIVFHCSSMSTWANAAAQARGDLDLVRRILINLWSGVDVFFVLSGYLIGRSLLVDLDRRRRLFYPSFFVRRAARILPAYYLVLTVALLAAGPWLPPIFEPLFGSLDPAALRSGAWTQYLFVSNYLLGPDDPSVIRVNWSLCIEEHFYLLLPPLLWLLHRSRDRRVHVAGLAAAVVVPIALRAAHWVADPTATVEAVYVESHYRFDELFVGVLLAYLHVHWPAGLARVSARLGYALPALGLGMIGTVWTFGSAFLGGPFDVIAQFALLAWGTAAVMAHVLTREGPITRFLSAPVWHPIARVSFGMYLLHPYVIFTWFAGPWQTVWVDAPLGRRVALLTLVTVAATWALAAVMYVLVERPALDAGRRLSRRLRADRGAGAAA